eukprot:4095417-Pyramimonas_sp.AAC.1
MHSQGNVMQVDLTKRNVRKTETLHYCEEAAMLCVRVFLSASTTGQSQSLNRNMPHPPTNHSPSIGICLTRRPIAAPR